MLIVSVPPVGACAQQAVHCNGLAAHYNDTSLERKKSWGAFFLFMLGQQ